MLESTDEQLKMRISEKIADDLYEVYSIFRPFSFFFSLLYIKIFKLNRIISVLQEFDLQIGFHEISLEYYKQMLVYACQTEDKIKALVSIGETAKELDRYEEAFNCFIEVENLESTLNVCDAKVRILILPEFN